VILLTLFVLVCWCVATIAVNKPEIAKNLPGQLDLDLTSIWMKSYAVIVSPAIVVCLVLGILAALMFLVFYYPFDLCARRRVALEAKNITWQKEQNLNDYRREVEEHNLQTAISRFQHHNKLNSSGNDI